MAAPPETPGIAGDPAAASRGNHRWMLVVCLTPLLIAGVAAAISVGGPSEPSVAVQVPAGSRAITDAYFGYAIPTSWRENDSATTDTGDYYYQGSSGWAGEVLAQRSTAPVLGEEPPSALGVFGSREAVAFTLRDGRPTTVPGATVAWSYQLWRGEALTGSVIDAWASGSATEVWLAVHADGATTAAVLGSLRA